MTDDAFYRPNRLPHSPTDIRPQAHQSGASARITVTRSYELRCQGESWGWETQILRDGELVIGRRFDLRQQAERWAEEERKALERDV